MRASDAGTARTSRLLAGWGKGGTVGVCLVIVQNRLLNLLLRLLGDEVRSGRRVKLGNRGTGEAVLDAAKAEDPTVDANKPPVADFDDRWSAMFVLPPTTGTAQRWPDVR
jgi:hypothetical protein